MAEDIKFGIKVTEDQLSAALTNIVARSQKAEEELAKLKKEAKGLGEIFKGVTIGNIVSTLAISGFEKLKSTISDGIGEAREFSKAISEINATLDNGAKVTAEQSRQIKALGIQFATSAAEQARGLKEIASGGVSNINTAFEILRKSNDAALAGFVNLKDASALVTSTFNAYASQGVSVAQITDTLVATTQLSAVKFEELSQSMGRVLNVAATTGISIGELSGSIATLRNLGLTSEQAITGLAGIINSVINPSKESATAAKKLGIEFNSAAIKAKGLTGFLEGVAKATQGNTEKLAELFGDQRAINAVLALSGANFDKYRETVNKATNSLGAAAKGASLVKEGLDFKLARQEAAFKAFSQVLGESLAPALTRTANLFTNILRNLTDLNPATDQQRALNALSKEYNRNADNLKLLGVELEKYSKIGADSSAKVTQEEITRILERQNAILKERQSIRGGKKEEESITTDNTIGSKNPPIAILTPEQIAAEKTSLAEIANIRAVSEAEQDFMFEQKSIERLDNKALQDQLLIDAELAKNLKLIEAQYQLEEQKALIETDAAKKSLLLQKANAIREAQTQKALGESSIKNQKLTAEQEKQIQNSRLQALSGFLNAGLTLAKQGSAEAKALQSATAVVSTYTAANQALSSPPGPPFTYPLVASVIAQGLANVARINSQKFAQGGLVSGASETGDKIPANLNAREMVLTQEQQANLFNQINSGGGSSGDIIIQIDGLEIARAVRNQIRGGFSLV